MGQKTHPRGFRVGITETWDSRWYAEKNYADLIQQDANIRKFLKNPSGFGKNLRDITDFKVYSNGAISKSFLPRMKEPLRVSICLPFLWNLLA